MNDELNFDAERSEAVDGLADKEAGIAEGDGLDPQVFPVGPVPFPPGGRHQVIVLVPLDDGFGTAQDGTQQLDGVALLCHISIQMVGDNLWRTLNNQREKTESGAFHLICKRFFSSKSLALLRVLGDQKRNLQTR